MEDVEIVRAVPSVSTSSEPSALNAEASSSASESSSANTEAGRKRPGSRARHRFTPVTSDVEHAGEGGAARIILRDRRRGRPKKNSEPPR